jgi:inner membrane protein
MTWWQWALLGLVLAAAEILTPGGFFVIFFGLAGLLIALLVAMGLASALWLQILLFSVFSVAFLLLFRNPLLRWMARRIPGPAEVDTLVGETATTSAAIPAGGVGPAQLRGTVWSARNGSSKEIPGGSRCRVVRVEGLVIWIELE